MVNTFMDVSKVRLNGQEHDSPNLVLLLNLRKLSPTGRRWVREDTSGQRVKTWGAKVLFKLSLVALILASLDDTLLRQRPHIRLALQGVLGVRKLS